MRVSDLESLLAQRTREANNAGAGHLTPHMAEKVSNETNFVEKKCVVSIATV